MWEEQRQKRGSSGSGWRGKAASDNGSDCLLHPSGGHGGGGEVSLVAILANIIVRLTNEVRPGIILGVVRKEEKRRKPVQPQKRAVAVAGARWPSLMVFSTWQPAQHRGWGQDR